MESNEYLEEEELGFLVPSNYPWGIFEKEESQRVEFPDDFVERIGTKIVIYCERQALLLESMEKISKMIRTNLASAPSYKIILDIFRYFEETEQMEKFASVTFNSMVHFGVAKFQEQEQYGRFIAWLVYAHRKRKFIEGAVSESKFGFIAKSLSDLFLLINRNDPEDFHYYSKFFSHLIKFELADLDIASEKAKKRSDYILNTHEFCSQTDTQGRHLFECILDNLYDLTQTETNEFSAYRLDKEGMQVLERLESVRSFAVQSLISQKAVAHNELVKQELKKKTCTPEDLLNAEELFFKCIVLFRFEKRYNFKYIAVEDIRILSQLFSIVLGFGAFLLSFLEWIELSLFQGVGVFILMLLHSGLFFTRKSIRGFYPEDQSPKLEFEISNFAEYFKKMSPDQLEKFLADRINDKNYDIYYTYIPDFVNYIYGLIRNKELVISTQDDVIAVIQKAEIMTNRKLAGLD